MSKKEGENAKFPSKNELLKNSNLLDDLKKLSKIMNKHSIWKSPLLLSCKAGSLSKDELKFLFSQYYYYSKNFTKLIAAVMIHCDNDYFRSVLSENLWEEGGGSEVENRHSEIFRKFLTNNLNLNINAIQFNEYSLKFFEEYLSLCMSSDHVIATAALSFGTESIVPRLYGLFCINLKAINLDENALNFFNIHMSCDDKHADTLKEIVLSYKNEDKWFERCYEGMMRALNLRKNFFDNIYKSMVSHSYIDTSVTAQKNFSNRLCTKYSFLKNSLYKLNKKLYSNIDISKKINFRVYKYPFGCNVLDPRLVTIEPGNGNELHSHAHETILLILEGMGSIIINDISFECQSGDIFYIPRWSKHRTFNYGNIQLKFFAITDFNLSRNFVVSPEKSYRLKYKNLSFTPNK